ncbi:MAG: hypothetical protein WD043_06095 [Gemmatimonadales bacterium]
MAEEIPESYLDGVLALDVSPRTVPHASRAEVFTLGECVPVDGEGEDLRSRVVLYHGSFRAVAAQDPAFDWRFEAWETLTHELRHHLEWRAHADHLERYDWAAEENFARQEGDPFDPLFFRAGEPVSPDVFRVEDDVFVDRVVRVAPAVMRFPWRGRTWEVDVPDGPLPLFLCVNRLPIPPAGDLIVVLRRRGRIRDLFRRPVPPRQARAVAPRAAGE